MESNSNDKRNQLDDYLARVQDAERKNKRRNALMVLLLATVGIGVAAGVWYYNENRVFYRTFVADDMTIYKMDSIFQNDKTPVILTYRYEDEKDTVASVDDYLTLDGVINSSSLNEETLMAIDETESVQDSIFDNVPAAIENELREESVESKASIKPNKKEKPVARPALQRYIFDVAGNRVTGQELSIKIEDYNSKIVYILDFGNGQKQRIRESKSFTYKKAGNYNLTLIATNSTGARSVYSKKIKIEQAPEVENTIVENKDVQTKSSAIKPNTESVKKNEVQSDSSDEPVANDLLTLAENAEIPTEKESKTLSKPAVKSNNTSSLVPLTFAEKMPSFPGGAKSMYKFLNKQLKYPPLARDNEIQGKVYVQFLVNSDGTLSQFKVVRGLGFGCDEEALRIAKLMPKWAPGEHGGRKVPVIYTLAVNYKF